MVMDIGTIINTGAGINAGTIINDETVINMGVGFVLRQSLLSAL